MQIHTCYVILMSVCHTVCGFSQKYSRTRLWMKGVRVDVQNLNANSSYVFSFHIIKSPYDTLQILTWPSLFSDVCLCHEHLFNIFQLVKV